MAKGSPITGLPLSPLTGVLDSRSAPDLMAASALRMRQNFQTTAENRLSRATGWTKLRSNSNYNNEDFHDQLLTFTDGAVRQPVTMLFESESTRKVRSLFVATQNRIARLNEYGGNYQIIGDGFGGTASVSAAAPRFHAAQVLDVLALTNDFDKPRYYQLETPSIDGSPLLNTFDDLDVIGLTRAGICWVWRNTLFFGDVEMDGERFAYRIVWSDAKGPLSFDPAKLESTAGSFDLDTYERVLGAKENPGSNSCAVYTTHSIWEMAVVQNVDGSASFEFVKRFNGNTKKGVAVLKYPNTLVDTPEGHLYCAEDGIYFYTPYSLEPERLEWLHRSSNLLYDGLDTTNCQVHVAAAKGDEVVLSMASTDAVNHCPDRSLRINTRYKTAEFMDHGWTALATYRPFKVPTIRDFIIENRICTLDGLASAGYPFVKEGLPRPLPSGTAPFEPDCIYTTTPKTIDGYPELSPEDWEQPEAGAHSLCTLLNGARIDDFCSKCEGPTILVGASSADWCLKEIGNVFYRERCVNPTAVGTTNSHGYSSAVGSYVLDPFDSILRFRPLFVPRGQRGHPYIRLNEVQLEALAVGTPANVKIRIGISSQVSDPNDQSDPEGNNRITWFEGSTQLLKYVTGLTVAQRKARNVQPSELIHWHLWRDGRVLYIEIILSGTGGESDWTSVVAEAMPLGVDNF